MNMKKVLLIMIIGLVANHFILFSTPSLQKVKKVSIVKNLDKKITKTTIYYRSNNLILHKQSEVKLLITNYVIYPNPASEYIEISLGSHSNSNEACPIVNEIEIYDVLGEVVWNSNSVPSKTLHRSVSTTERIDISHLPRGLYFVRIGARVEKFIKN